MIHMDEYVWFDQFGRRVEGPTESAYKVPPVICSAAESGVHKDVFNRLKFEYPSLQHIKNHSTQKTHGVMVINLPGVFSHQDPREIMYKLVIDARDFPRHKPQAFVFFPEDDEIEHCNIYRAKSFSVWPNKLLAAICDGITGEIWESMQGDEIFLFASWLHQVHQVLNNPNPDDTARGV